MLLIFLVILPFIEYLFDYLVFLLYRADYNPDQYLWEKNFTLAGRAYQRQDLEASMDGQILPLFL